MPNMFPYTNTHELNLDWILQVVKDFQSKYSDFGQTVADALEAIEAAKTGSLEDMQTALTNAIAAISADQATAQAAIAADQATAQAAIASDQSAALLALQAALTAALTSITTEQTSATQIIEHLYNTLPASAQDILGRLRVLDTIITGYTPSNSFQWLQGSYIYPEGVTPPTPPEINSTSETVNKYVSNRYMEGVAGQRIRITTDGSILIDVINIWTSTPPGGSPSQYIVGELEVTETYADVILPLNVTAFSIQFAGLTEENDISPNDIPGHVDVRWVTDFVGQATIAPKETSNTANIARNAGELFFLDGVLYAATADIAIGDTIVTSGAGANCEETTVDEELQGTEDSITDLKSAFNASLLPVAFAPTITLGEYIKLADGTKAEWYKAARTGLWNGYGTRIAIALACADYKFAVFFYDENGSLTASAGENGYIGNSTYGQGIRYIPENAVRIGVTFQRVDGENMTSEDVTAISAALSAYAPTDTTLSTRGMAADAKTVGDALTPLQTAATALPEMQKNISTLQMITALENIYLPFSLTDGTGYITSNGSVGSNSTTRVTDFVDVRGISQIVFKCTGVESSSTAWYTAYYNEDFSFNSSTRNYHSQSARGYIDRTKTIPSGVAYARFTVFTDTETYGDFAVWIEKYPLKTTMEALDQKITDEVSLNASMSMYDSFGVCGASWDCGYYIVDGTSHRVPKLSWGQNVARRNGSQCGIYAYQGLTTKTWLSSTYGLSALLADTAKDLYICTFGGNDAAEGASWLGSISDITSHESYADYDDSFYGNYGRIIEQIKAHAPNALMILIMNYDSTRHSANRGNFYNAVVEIGAHYGLPVMNWDVDEWYNSSFVRNSMVSDHPTAPIYSGIALAWERVYSKCVAKNYNYFKTYLKS